MSIILFDSGSTYSQVSVRFALGLHLIYDILDSHVYRSTPIGDSVVVTHVYHVCSVLFKGSRTWIDLISLDMLDFDIILGMTWLSPYHVVLNYNAKTLTLEIP